MPKLGSYAVMILMLSAAALLVRPAPAYACSCSRPGVEVTPGAGLAAPTNTVVRVSWWVGEVKVDESTLVVVVASKDSKDKRGKRGKDSKSAKDVPPVDVEQTAVTAGQQRTVTLRPKAPLAPETRYEVRVAAVAGEKPGVVGEFTTGAAADDKPPEWAGVGKASYVHAQAVCCNCSTNDPYAEIELVDADKTGDDLTPPVALVYGVWLDDGKPFDATQAPVLLTRAWSGKLYLGHKSECAPVNFALPATTKAAATLKLQVAPIDLAGHVGKPAGVTVEVPAAPKPAAPKKPS